MTPEAILKRLDELGISARASGDKLRVEPGSRVPPELVPEIRQHKQGILELLGVTSLSDDTTHLLAWAAQAAEAGTVLTEPVHFLETSLRPYTTTQVGRYCREQLRYLALARTNRATGGGGRFTPEWWQEMEAAALQALSAIKAAVDQAGLLAHGEGSSATEEPGTYGRG